MRYEDFFFRKTQIKCKIDFFLLTDADLDVELQILFFLNKISQCLKKLQKLINGIPTLKCQHQVLSNRFELSLNLQRGNFISITHTHIINMQFRY